MPATIMRVPVRQWLERPGWRIKPIFLPTYASYLNAMDRLWGVLRREVTPNKSYESFDLFARAIDDFPTSGAQGATPSPTTPVSSHTRTFGSCVNRAYHGCRHLDSFDVKSIIGNCQESI